MESREPSGLGTAEAELTEQIADAMRAASRSYMDALVRDLSAAGYAGLTPATTSLLSRIPIMGLQAAALAQSAGKSKQAIAKLIEELEAAGYVRRVADPNDRRGQLVLLTERGDEVLSEGAQVKARLAEHAVSVLGSATMERLHQDLDALSALFAGAR